MTAWRFLISRHMSIDSYSKTEEIINLLIARNKQPLDNPGLLYGNAGMALVYANLHQHTGETQYADRAITYIKYALDQVSNKDMSLASGITGVAYAIRILIQNDLLHQDDDKLLTQFDLLIGMSLDRDLTGGNMDFLFGALGKAAYALLSGQQSHFIVSLHDYFSKDALSSNKGYLWRLKPEEHHDLSYDLGMAHGHSTVLSFLAKTLDHSENPKRIKELIKKGAIGLMSCHLKDAISYFPPESKGIRPSRLAWCNGDLGMIAALFASHEATRDSAILNAGLAALRLNAGRNVATSLLKSDHETMETNLCHGILSPAFFFQLAYRAYPEESVFRSASDYWMNQFLAQYQKQSLRQFDYAKGDWKIMPGLLEGDAGIMLFLSSYIHNDFSLMKKILLFDAF